MITIRPETAALLERIDMQLARLKMSPFAATQKAGINADAIRNLRRGRQRELGVQALTKLAHAINLTPGQLMGLEPMPDGPHVLPEKKRFRQPTAQANASAPFTPAPIMKKRIPILGHAVGGDDGRFIMNGEVIDTTFCPPGYEDVPGLYAVYVSGSSMEPRYEAGETVWVHPGRPPRRGNYVVVQIHGEQEADPPEGFVKRFVSWTPSKLVVEQLNPQQEITFDRDEVISVHPIIFQGQG